MLTVGQAQNEVAFPSGGVGVGEGELSPEERVGRVSDGHFTGQVIEMRGILLCLAPD